MAGPAPRAADAAARLARLPRLARDAVLAGVALAWVLGGTALGVVLLAVSGAPGLPHRAPGLPHRVARRWWAPFLLRLAGARLEVTGRERVDFDRPHLFVLNHRSLLDIPIAMIALPCPLLFVAKERLLRVPFLAAYLRAMGMVVIPRRRRIEALDRLRRATAILAEGRSLVSFPEGTRGPAGEVARFKSGVFLPAIEAGTPVVPVAIAGSGHVLPRGRLERQPGTIRVTIGDPVATTDLALSDRRRLAREIEERVIATLGEGAPGRPDPA